MEVLFFNRRALLVLPCFWRGSIFNVDNRLGRADFQVGI